MKKITQTRQTTGSRKSEDLIRSCRVQLYGYFATAVFDPDYQNIVVGLTSPLFMDLSHVRIFDCNCTVQAVPTRKR